MRRPVVMGVTVAATAVGVLLGSAAVAAPPKAAKPPKLGPNLVVNPSFEQSTADPATANGVPVLPTAWTVEGTPLLFDYNQRGGRTGTRNVAISGSVAPGAQVCDASTGTYTCVANPAHSVTGQVTESSMSTMSVRPFWVTDAAVAVTAGKTYRFSAWMIRPSLDPNAGVVGEGAVTKLRWTAADGSTVKVTDGPALLKSASRRDLGFKLVAKDVVAPAGATGAVLMLGHSDYTVTSAQVAFDEVAFQQVGR
jgi:hypothetical protein